MDAADAAGVAMLDAAAVSPAAAHTANVLDSFAFGGTAARPLFLYGLRHTAINATILVTTVLDQI
jgi:hypothetical protein